MKQKTQRNLLLEVVGNWLWIHSRNLCQNLLVPLSLALFAFARSISAQDLVWDNGANTGNWNTSDINWSGAVWDNSVPDNAVFTSIGGIINLSVPIIAGDVTFGSASANCTNSSFNSGSLQASSLTVQGFGGNSSPPIFNLTLNVPTVSIAGDAAVGKGLLAITNGSFAANQINSADEWGYVIIAGPSTVTANNGVDGLVNAAQTFGLDLEKGSTLYTSYIQVAGRNAEPVFGSSFFYWNGGKVVATASTNNFIMLYSGLPAGLFGITPTNVYVGDGGAILDTAGYDIEIGVNLASFGTGGLTKLGVGTLTCAGTNTYTGNTIIDEGTLVIDYPSLDPASTVILNSSAVLNLNFAGTNSVGGLIISGATMPPGVYNASTTPASISGSGSLLVPANAPRNLVWNNGAATGNWNTTDANWTGNTWDNGRVDNALFTTFGGDVNLTVPITAGMVRFHNSGNNFMNTSFKGGSLYANSLTLSGFTGSGPTNTFNVLTVVVPTVSIAGDVALGCATLAITNGNFSANQITSDTDQADWATLMIAGNATVMVTNGINGSPSGGVFAPDIFSWTFGLELDGGTLYTPYIDLRIASFARAVPVIWNGGKVVATTSTTNFIELDHANENAPIFFTNAVSIGQGGAILDTAGYDIGLGVNLIPVSTVGDGGLTKLGAGTLTCSGTNNYNGNTTVAQGTLVFNTASLGANSTVTIGSGAVLNLNLAYTNTIAMLVIGGVPKPAGIYNSSNAAGSITGIGSLMVIPPLTLSITRSGANVVLTWDGGGVLQSSTNVGGTYTDIVGSNSPWTNSIMGAQMYYRVRQ
jgi:autotransporter-associated beta strand protein